MRPLLILIGALLTGCASFNSEVLPIDEPEHNRMILAVYKRDPDMPADRNGWARHQIKMHKAWLPDWIDTCHISTRNYPLELGHEMGHCFNGNFHGTPDTDHYKYSLWD